MDVNPPARPDPVRQHLDPVRQNLDPVRQIPTLCAHDHLAYRVFKNSTVATLVHAPPPLVSCTGRTKRGRAIRFISPLPQTTVAFPAKEYDNIDAARIPACFLPA